ncbi:hypothetical protein [Mesorhizobium sp. 1M-11]|uniref:hypothetical protein n=1 Tax=Mesorhizobium sp. 1M-11 TaxID=1529006 RepID=UPI0006C7712F|nr:hypothetical protein [Mesorhizobium sp. 1M-11]
MTKRVTIRIVAAALALACLAETSWAEDETPGAGALEKDTSGTNPAVLTRTLQISNECPSSNDLRRFGLWKTGVSGSVCGLI